MISSSIYNTNCILNKNCCNSIFKRNNSNKVLRNQWVISSIGKDTKLINTASLGGMMIKESSKLFDLLNTNLLSVQLKDKMKLIWEHKQYSAYWIIFLILSL